jgi:4-amino-4-deoxy-L-arabinose transferase-like glycosyltransferase
MQLQMAKNPYGWLYLLITLCVFVNFSGLFITILGPDGALYASIAKTMVLRDNYIDLYVEGKHWLDKPHFPFWITAFSFKLFGFQTWAYKLPAILFLLAGTLYTYLFAKKLYNKEVALWSVIILLTAEHIIISNNDVRAEPYLTALVIAGVYHFYTAWKNKSTLHLVCGAFFTACAIMTKGMFAIIPIAGAIAGELIIKKQWKELFHIRWLFAAVLIFLFILPELYCLYQQFDAHPEREVFGKTHVSGIRFFFWDSQFGRFFNTGPIKGKGNPLFFVHTTLWAFLPWSLMLFAAVFTMIRRYWRVPSTYPEWLTLSGALMTFMIFSASRFQLPHYINIIFPFFAIICAGYLYGSDEKNGKRIQITQNILAVLLLLGLIALHWFFRPQNSMSFIVILLILLFGWIMTAKAIRTNRKQKIILYSAMTVIILNTWLNLIFYPQLLKYQSGSEAAYFSNENYPGMPVAQLKSAYSYPLKFYLNQPLIALDSLSPIDPNLKKPFLLYISADSASAVSGKMIKKFPHFPVSRLNGKFINFKTRAKEAKAFELYLVE